MTTDPLTLVIVAVGVVVLVAGWWWLSDRLDLPRFKGDRRRRK